MNRKQDPHRKALARSLSPEVEKKAAEHADTRGLSFARALMDQNLMSEEEVGKALAKYYRTEYVPWSRELVMADVPENTVGSEFFRRWGAMAIAFDDKTIDFIMPDPSDLSLRDGMVQIIGSRIPVFKVTLPETLEKLFATEPLRPLNLDEVLPKGNPEVDLSEHPGDGEVE